MTGRAKLAWGFILVLGIVHFDFWAWDDDTLVFGFVPMALAFHAGLSIAAALGWAFVVVAAWPDEVEDWASGGVADEEGAQDRNAR